jgi:ABC-2 type transport system ATP-binding protein
MSTDGFWARRPASGPATAPAAAPDPSLAVCARGLSKHYRNPWTMRVVRGLEPLDLEVRRGEVLGYLGPNGAGKTTTLKILTGLLKPTAGRAWLMGEPIERVESRRRLGFLPEQPYFFDYLNGVEYLELAGRLSGLGARAARASARVWLGRVGLGERPRLVLRKYSKGMLQRLGLAAALVHGPELLILDEPMSGLDPIGRREVRDLILEQREAGTTVLFSSHILPDVEMLCDRAAIIVGGRLARVATVGELMGDGPRAVEIVCDRLGLVEVPGPLAGCVARAERLETTVFRLEDAARVDEVLAWLLRVRAHVRAVSPQRSSLEDLFLSEAHAAADPDAARRSA